MWRNQCVKNLPFDALEDEDGMYLALFNLNFGASFRRFLQAAVDKFGEQLWRRGRHRLALGVDYRSAAKTHIFRNSRNQSTESEVEMRDKARRIMNKIKVLRQKIHPRLIKGDLEPCVALKWPFDL